MLSVLNLITAFKEKLVSQRESVLDIIEPYVNAIVDDELDLDITWQEGGFETEISREKYMAYFDMFEVLVNKSFQLQDGVVFGVTKEVITDETHEIIIYKDGMHNNEEICRLIHAIEGPYITYFIGWNGWDVSHRSSLGANLRAFYDGYLDTECIATTAMTAIDLCCKGQLDPTNLSAALTTFSNKGREVVKEVANIIITNVSGTDAGQQSIGLLTALKQLYANAFPENITVDEDRINFHPIEYNIESAIMLPVEGIVSSVATMVGMIIGYFGHPIGFIISAAGMAISGLLQMAQTEFGDDWNISNQAILDNDACCIPISSGKMAASFFPQEIVEYTEKYGYLRSENSLYVMYTWIDPQSQLPETTIISYEIFPNVNINLGKRIHGNINQWMYEVSGSVTYSTSAFTFTPPSSVTVASDIGSLFNDGETVTNEDKVQYPTDLNASMTQYQNRAITFGMIHQFIYLASRVLAAYCSVNELQSIEINEHLYTDSWMHIEKDDDSDSWTEEKMIKILASFLAWAKGRIDNNTLDAWTDIADGNAVVWSDCWRWQTSGLINGVYRACTKLRLANARAIDRLVVMEIFETFDTVAVMGDIYNESTLDVMGSGKKWSCSPCITYVTDFLVTPPKNRYSFVTRLVMTTLVVAAIATVTAITASKLKRRVGYLAQVKQKELNALRDKFQASNSWEDYNALYTATKRYNRSFGLLTGTTFDMSNAWVNERTATSTLGSVADVFPASMVEDETTGKPGFDLSPVINLIK